MWQSVCKIIKTLRKVLGNEISISCAYNLVPLLRSCRFFFLLQKKNLLPYKESWLLCIYLMCTMYVIYTHLFLITQRFYLDLGKPSTYILLSFKNNDLGFSYIYYIFINAIESINSFDPSRIV